MCMLFYAGERGGDGRLDIIHALAKVHQLFLKIWNRLSVDNFTVKSRIVHYKQ
jgi:hypothetical protein